MRWDGTGIPYIEPGDDFGECAKSLAGVYDDEFALFASIDPDSVEAAVVATFMPMAIRLATPDGPHSFLLPKLHLERCLLDPRSARATRTARRESARYSFGLNAAFREVVWACVETHGSDWLVPELVDSFCRLHDERLTRRSAFISVELWNTRGTGDELVAGEIGYLVGSAYASLTGFSRVSGAGTVQLAALGSALAAAGVRIWDLGMPLGYKLGLGGRVLPRDRFMRTLGRAYGALSAPIRTAFLPASVPVPARAVLDSGRNGPR